MIDILMASYNGADYIEKQIDSILHQTYQEFLLWIRDDGSSDRTMEILNRYEKEYPEKIRIIRDGKGNLGVRLNFNELLQYSKQEYCMFCDQDDIWLPEKIEKTLRKMQEIEQGRPAFVFTDLMLIDEKDRVISDSMWEYAGVNPKETSLSKLLYQNVATGCTVMINRALVRLAGTIPAECDMHDYWLALLAASFGVIDYLPEPLIQYRQHMGNQIGSFHIQPMKERFKKLAVFADYLKSWKKKYQISRKQIYCLVKRYGKRYNKTDRQMLINYVKIPKMSVRNRLRVLFHYRFWPEGRMLEMVKMILVSVFYGML